MGHHEEIEQRQREQHERHHEAEEHEDDMCASDCAGRRVASFSREPSNSTSLDRLKRSTICLISLVVPTGSLRSAPRLASERGMVAGAQFLAPFGDHLQAPAERIALEQRQTQGDDASRRPGFPPPP